MTNSPPAKPSASGGFALEQLRASILLSVVFLLCVGVAIARRPIAVANPMPETGDRLADADGRLDPNSAPARWLSALPNLGPTRAAAIVAYRARVLARDPTRVVFRSKNDLLRIDGIGANMANQMEPFLRFPTAATRPS